MDEKKFVAGAQSLRRALQLLRLLAQNQEEGMKLNEVIGASELERSTAHRLLSCLVEEQFAERDPDSKLYRLGIDAMQLGFDSMRRVPLVDSCRALTQKLARMSGDTVFLMIRQGDYCVCLHREEGHFPVKVFTTNVGERRLLGIGAGGLALLAGLSESHTTRFLERHEMEYTGLGFTKASLLHAVRQTRQTGWADTVDTITTGVSGVGCMFAPSAGVQAAISFGAITQRLPEERKQQLAHILKEALLKKNTD